MVHAALLREGGKRWRAIIACCQQQRHSAPLQASLFLWAPAPCALNSISNLGADSKYEHWLQAFWKLLEAICDGSMQQQLRAVYEAMLPYGAQLLDEALRQFEAAACSGTEAGKAAEEAAALLARSALSLLVPGINGHLHIQSPLHSCQVTSQHL
jgi:hypothetical protein